MTRERKGRWRGRKPNSWSSKISSKAPIFASISPKSQTLAHPQACQPPKVRTLSSFRFLAFKHSFSSEKMLMWQFFSDHAAAQYIGPKSCRGILILCNSGSILAAAQKFHIESCRGSVLFLLKIDFFPSKWVTPMCFGILSFILTSHLPWL